jgi:hypothetical protein
MQCWQVIQYYSIPHFIGSHPGMQDARRSVALSTDSRMQLLFYPETVVTSVQPAVKDCEVHETFNSAFVIDMFRFKWLRVSLFLTFTISST